MRVFYIHIPKTAGTTMSEIMYTHYVSGEVFTCPSVGDTDSVFVSLLESDQQRKNLIKLVTGHIQFGWHRVFGEDEFTYVTLLRDPVDRVMSLYYSARASGIPRHYLWEGTQGVSLGEWVKNRVTPETFNWQTYMIAGVHSELELAKQNLLRHFSVVGFTDQFDLALARIAQLLGWDVPVYKSLNVTPNRPLLQDISDEDRTIVEAHNLLDIELYQFAKEMAYGKSF